MKTKFALFSFLVIILFAFIPHDHTPPVLEIGAEAPLRDHLMRDVSGKEISFAEKMDKNGLLVIFSCNTCPFVVGKENSEGWEGRYNEVAEKAKFAGVSTMLINSNEAKRDNGDSFDDMVKRAKDYKYTMSYVLDKDHIMADAFGARTTPHVFLFNNQFQLVYKGAIDDNNDRASDVKETWLINALNNLSEGNVIDPNSTRNMGCSIKRVKKE